MDIKEVCEKLCYYDKRNPDNMVLDSGKKPRVDCYCDNCFYGRDQLALEIIALKELLKEGD